MNDPSSPKEEALALLSALPVYGGESLPPGATDADLADFERRTGIRVPPKLADWLRTCNGPYVGDCLLQGINPPGDLLDIEDALVLYPVWRQGGWIPIAGDGCGNYYLVATRSEFGDGEPVFFIDVMNDPEVPTYLVASDTWHFLRFKFQRELGGRGWPFGREEVLAADPGIAAFHGVPLPWEA